LTNFNKLFTLDSETIDILKDTKNQSKFVRDAVKQFNKQGTIIQPKEIKELENIEVEI